MLIKNCISTVFTSNQPKQDNKSIDKFVKKDYSNNTNDSYESKLSFTSNLRRNARILGIGNLPELFNKALDKCGNFGVEPAVFHRDLSNFANAVEACKSSRKARKKLKQDLTGLIDDYRNILTVLTLDPKLFPQKLLTKDFETRLHGFYRKQGKLGESFYNVTRK